LLAEYVVLIVLMFRLTPEYTLFPTRRSSDLAWARQAFRHCSAGTVRPGPRCLPCVRAMAAVADGSRSSGGTGLHGTGLVPLAAPGADAWQPRYAHRPVWPANPPRDKNCLRPAPAAGGSGVRTACLRFHPETRCRRLLLQTGPVAWSLPR